VRVRMVMVAALLAASMAGCASSGGASSAPEPAGPHLTVVASGIAFDTKELKFTANQPTTIWFQNRDNGVPHNITISAMQGGPATFDGEIISQGAIVYTVPAYGPGAYFFSCKVHPNMNGTVTVTP
jgi:plastocyanin